MPLFVIALIKQNDTITGFRLFNTDKATVNDYDANFISNRLSLGLQIENLGKEGDTFIWKSGAEDRYPSFVNGEITKNSSIIITGVIPGEPKRYNTIDAYGRFGIHTEDEVVRAGEIVGLANCKIVNRDGKKFIQVIGGKLPEQKIGVGNLRILGDTLIFPLKIGELNQIIDIPRFVNGRSISYVKSIKFEPSTELSNIHTVRFPLEIGKITYQLVQDMIYAKRLVFCSSSSRVDRSTFKGFSNLEEIYFKSIYSIGSSAFYGCTNLRKFYVEDVIEYICSKAFYGCINLNINDILKLNIIRINGDNIFEGCRADAITTNPATVAMTVGTFNGIAGLKKIVWRGKNLKLRCLCSTDTFNLGDAEIVISSPDVFDFNGMSLREYYKLCDDMSWPKPNFVINKEICGDDIANVKYKLVGISNLEGKKAVSLSDMTKCISISSQSDLDKAVDKTVASFISGAYSNVTCSLGQFYIDFYLMRFDTRRIKNYYKIGNNHIIYYRATIYIVVSDKRLITERMLMDRIRYASVTLPIYYIDARNGKVDDIIIEQDRVVAKFRSKKILPLALIPDRR